MSLVLTPKQEEALALLNGPQRNTLLVGGARSGKTFIFCLAVVVRALKAPGSRHGIFRYRANSVWTSIGMDTLPKVAKIIGCPLKANKQDRYFTLPNGAEIWLAGLDEKERVEKILGMEFVTIYENEASQIPYDSHLILSTRLAQVCPGLKQRHFIDLNPSGAGHWTYLEFIDKIEPGSKPKRPKPDPENYAHLFINPRDNAENLSPETLQAFQNLPERQRKRFYEGSYQSEVDGALWSPEVIARARCDKDGLPDMRRVVVAVDPSGTKGDPEGRSNDVGIIVAGTGVDGRYYVLDDLTCQLPPAGWASRAVQAYHDHNADKLVAEQNFGGSMVEEVIRQRGPHISYKEVTASRGKVVRAEPISDLYSQGLVSHAGSFDDLEDQMGMMTTGGFMGMGSPDRVDALVWALAELSGGTSMPVFSAEASQGFAAAMASKFGSQNRYSGL